MRLGGRMAAAIEVLDTLDRQKRPVSEVLKDWGIAHRFAGSGDRAAIGNLVYDALRKKLSHAYLMDDDSPQTLIYAAVLRQWGMDSGKLSDQLKDDRFAPEPLSDAALQAFGRRKLSKAPPHVQG